MTRHGVELILGLLPGDPDLRGGHRRHAGAQELVAFHHEPSHDDDFLDRFFARYDGTLGMTGTGTREGDVRVLGAGSALLEPAS